VTDRDMNMVHYPVFAEPFVLVVIRGALDMLQLIQPQVADIPLARAACDWSKPFHRREREERSVIFFVGFLTKKQKSFFFILVNFKSVKKICCL